MIGIECGCKFGAFKYIMQLCSMCGGGLASVFRMLKYLKHYYTNYLNII
jgi:hypothetical protein